MKMYLGINTAIPIGYNCVAEIFLTRLRQDCLLTKNGSMTDYKIGLMKNLNATGANKEDFYSVGF